MKRVFAGTLILCLGILAGCGGSNSSSSSTPPTSGLMNRAFVSNAFSGSGSAEADTVLVIDASKDQLSAKHPLIGGITTLQFNQPSLMVLSPARDIIAIFNMGNNSVAQVVTATETIKDFVIQLPNFTESMVLKDSATGFAAIPNASVSGQTELGSVVVLDLTNVTISNTVGVPRAHRLVLSHNGSKLAVFSDHWMCKAGSGDTSDCVTILDTTANPPTATNISGFNRPVNGVFSADDSTLFVMNCGQECGSTTGASVQPLAVANNTPATAVPVSAATVGILSGSTLYVAGTTGGVLGNGKLDVLSLTNNVPSVTRAGVNIGDGFHTRMVLASNNKLFIGAQNCTNTASVEGTGCLTIFDTAANTAVVDAGKGNVTGMAPIPLRNIVYVCEGGELRIYDTGTSREFVSASIDVSGNAFDVVAPD